jgi:putative membrane protein
MNADKFFTAAEKERIQQAVTAAESKTAGEIVPIIVTSSARYTEIELLALVAGLFVGVIVEWFWSDPWGSEYLNLWPVIGAFVGFFVGRMQTVKRLVASKNRIS